MTVVKTCKACDGKGYQLAMRSWFIQDGVRRMRCWCCGGTGESNYIPARDHLASQKRCREIAALSKLVSA